MSGRPYCVEVGDDPEFLPVGAFYAKGKWWVPEEPQVARPQTRTKLLRSEPNSNQALAERLKGKLSLRSLARIAIEHFGLYLRREDFGFGRSYTLSAEDWSTAGWFLGELMREPKKRPVYRSETLEGIRDYLRDCLTTREVSPDEIIRISKDEAEDEEASGVME